MKSPKNIKRKYSNKLADSSEHFDHAHHAGREALPGEEKEGSYPYELHHEFNKILHDAHKCVKSVIDKKDSGEQVSGLEAAPPETESSRPGWPVSPAFVRWLVRIGLVAATFLLLRSSWHDYFREGKEEAGAYNDVLTSIDASRADCEKVKGYVKYIIQKVASEGVESIEGKWAAGVPPSFKSDARRKAEMLGTGYVFGNVFADKGVIYIVECHPSFNPAKTAFFEVVREKVGDEVLFRLQKIY